MLTYASGTAAQIGDHVDYDGMAAVVEHVIDTLEEQKNWGLNERGLMFNTNEMGLVFASTDSGSWDSIVFQSRAKMTP